MRVYQTVFLYTLYLSFVLTVFAILGISRVAPVYLTYVRTFLQVFIGLILVYFYNPLTNDMKERKFTDFDRRLIFSSGMFLLFTSVLVWFIIDYIGILNIVPFGENIRNVFVL